MLKLPENFIIDKKTDWFNISIYYELSEDFIEKYFNRLDIYHISSRQKLSENFIERYKNKLDFNALSFNSNILRKIKRKFEMEYYTIKTKRLFFRKKCLKI